MEHYSTISLRYDPLLNLMDLYVDDVDQGVNLTSTPYLTAAPRLEWGYGFSPNVAANEVRYAKVEFSTVPEPSTWALAAFSLAFLGALAWKKRCRI